MSRYLSKYDKVGINVNAPLQRALTHSGFRRITWIKTTPAAILCTSWSLGRPRSTKFTTKPAVHNAHIRLLLNNRKYRTTIFRTVPVDCIPLLTLKICFDEPSFVSFWIGIKVMLENYSTSSMIERFGRFQSSSTM